MSYRRVALANIEDLYKELETGPEGLSDQEAERRLAFRNVLKLVIGAQGKNQV